MQVEEDKTGASVKFPPPLIFVLSMIIAYAAHRFMPVEIGVSGGFETIGVAVVALGIGCFILAVRTLKSADTNVEPWKPTSSIVSTGIFAYTRNPIYLGFSIVVVGVGIFLDSVWVLLSFLPSVAAVYFIAIRKEEAYLEKKFAGEYLQYKARVRRWL